MLIRLMEKIMTGTFYAKEDLMKTITKEQVLIVADGLGIKDQRRINECWRLATEDEKIKRVSVERRNKAVELWKLIRKERQLTDKELELDSQESTCHGKLHQKIIKQQEQVLNCCKALCEELNLTLSCGTYAHIYASKKYERQIL